MPVLRWSSFKVAHSMNVTGYVAAAGKDLGTLLLAPLVVYRPFRERRTPRPTAGQLP